MRLLAIDLPMRAGRDSQRKMSIRGGTSLDEVPSDLKLILWGCTHTVVHNLETAAHTDAFNGSCASVAPKDAKCISPPKPSSYQAYRSARIRPPCPADGR